MYNIFEMENTIEYTVHILPTPTGKKFFDINTPYAVTKKGTNGPVAHVTDIGTVVKQESLAVFGDTIVSSKDEKNGLEYIVREFFPEGTDHKDVFNILHG